jgi:uncharacterized protein (UPF0264 family)
MLVSVTSVDEALIALDAGVEMIDLKNPSEGALGALEHALVREIVLKINHLSSVSATIGDLVMEPSLILDATKTMLETGVDIVKIGFFGQIHHTECLNALKPLAAKSKLIAVLFADQNPNLALLPFIADAGFYGVMLDTANKSNGHLLNYFNADGLLEFVARASALGLETGLAGSVQKSHVKELCNVKPSYLGFRGALCEQHKRVLSLDPIKMLSIKNMLH